MDVANILLGEGVTKSLFSYWFESKYHGKLFYLGSASTIKEIDKVLLRIKPPHEFRRTPRSIKTSKHWKASEFRAWLIVYSIPVLKSFLPPDYIKHLSLLVTSMHILLSDSISSSQLELANLMLIRFYELSPELYDANLCSFNMHSLIHVCKFVRHWGPLWCYSTFGFENFNGYLKKHSHGTRNVLPQMIKAVRLRQALPLLARKLGSQENTATMSFIGDGNRTKTTEGLGKIVNKTLSSDQVTVLRLAGLDTPNSVPTYPRYKINGIVYFSSNEQRVRNSSVCQLRIRMFWVN